MIYFLNTYLAFWCFSTGRSFRISNLPYEQKQLSHPMENGSPRSKGPLILGPQVASASISRPVFLGPACA